MQSVVYAKILLMYHVAMKSKKHQKALDGNKSLAIADYFLATPGSSIYTIEPATEPKHKQMIRCK